uniref:Retroviral polymerase SH3-like domain-containing protein n=1 Tax=Tanacetum cinerariifolium TaxID=118510 RepID=A0A6L2KKI1_TANCI|nr:hypothetical protein [Tanacetum cinerariifolium]
MDFRSTSCVFLGYNPSHHGHRYLDISTECLYIARHVHFNEAQFPFDIPNTTFLALSKTSPHYSSESPYVILTTDHQSLSSSRLPISSPSSVSQLSPTSQTSPESSNAQPYPVLTTSTPTPPTTPPPITRQRGNRGIGLEICRQLATKGVEVILTSRNESHGLEAVEKLNISGLSNINNAAIIGVIIHEEEFRAGGGFVQVVDEKAHLLTNIIEQPYELGEECLKTNYYATKTVTEALIPLLQLSKSPRIVNLSSIYGDLYWLDAETALYIRKDKILIFYSYVLVIFGLQTMLC